MNTIKILIIDDYFVYRTGLKLILSAQADIEVVAEASSSMEAVNMAAGNKPELVLMEPFLSTGDDGFTIIPELEKINPHIKILVLSNTGRVEYLHKALEAGACGYILKKATDMELLYAIRAVNKGEYFIDPLLTKNLLTIIKNKKENSQKKHTKTGLNNKERDTLMLIARGYTNKQVANNLGISAKTVENRKTKIKEKLNLNSRADFIKYAIQKGLLYDDQVEGITFNF